MTHQNNPKECCPEFEVDRWDEKIHNWDNKPFLKDSIPAFFHIPLFPPMIGKKIMKMWKMAEDVQKVESDKKNILVLFYDPHAFKSEMYLSVTGDVPGARNVTISGTFVSKVFDGPYNAIPKFIKQMEEYLAGRDKKAQKYYVHYTYCPKCAKKLGHNYAVLFARVG